MTLSCCDGGCGFCPRVVTVNVQLGGFKELIVMYFFRVVVLSHYFSFQQRLRTIQPIYQKCGYRTSFSYIQSLLNQTVLADNFIPK